MKLLLSVPSARPIGRVLLNEILGIGFDGVRVDVPDNHAGAEAVIGELARMPEVFPIFLLAGGTMLRETGKPFSANELVDHTRDVCIKLRDFGYFRRSLKQQPAIEIGNEPDLAHDDWKKTPRELARTFRRCFDVVREYSNKCPVLTPSVSNLNRRGYRYLEQMLHEGVPAGAKLAVHRYPHDGDIFIPHPGFKSREEQASKLVELAEGRDIWVTETGLTEGPHDGLFHTEEQVANAFEYDVNFWANVASVRALTLYQINDGAEKNNPLHRYGIRRLDGTWKPIARRVATVRADMETRA